MLDLSDDEVIYAGHRFWVYAMFPECDISMHGMWGRAEQNTVCTVGKSIFDRSNPVEVGQIMLEYSGVAPRSGDLAATERGGRRDEGLADRAAGSAVRPSTRLRLSQCGPTATLGLSSGRRRLKRRTSSSARVAPVPWQRFRRGGEPVTTTTEIELPIDFSTMDDTGLPWAFLDEAADPSRIVPGAHLVAGSGTVRAVVVVVDVTDDGIVHVCDVPGSVDDNAHLLVRNESTDGSAAGSVDGGCD